MTSNMIYIVALGVGFKCPRKIHLNTQWGGLNPPSTPACDSPAEAFVLFMEKIRERSHLKVSIPCFPGVLGERTEKGMMFTRHHSVEK